MNEKEIWERLTAVEESAKSAHHRINNIEELTKSVSNMVVEVKHMREDVNDVREDVEELRQKPIKRYELIITSIITTICGAVVGYLLSLVIGG